MKNFVCGLDIGTAKLCATCGRVEAAGKIDILASQTVPTQGVRAGRIRNSKKFSACIRDLVYELRKMSGIKIRRVYANIDSLDLRAKMYEERINFGKKTRINKFHIDRLINSAISANISLDRKVIHTGFRNFILDNRIESSHPEGLRAHDMKLNIVIVSALIPTINSFIKSIREAGLILENMVPSGCAQVLALYRNSQSPPTPFRQGRAEQHRKNDILIDVGAALTKITLLKDRLIEDLAILPLGAQSITKDIAGKLKVSYDCAEQLKVKYGRAYFENRLLNQKIIIKDKFIDRIVQSKGLYEIITSKVDHLLHKIKQALLELNYEEKCAEIVVTGGGSILEGFLERAEKILEKPVKMGNLAAVKDSRIQGQSALYATSVGLIHFAAQSRGRRTFQAREKFGSFTQTLGRLKQLYREYF